MFDTYVQGRTETQLIPYVKTVHEHKAPTDDSIRIYKEIKEKAYNSLLYSFTLSDNIFDAKVMVYQDYELGDRVCAYSFLLNGRRVKNEFRSRNILMEKKEELIPKIIEGISEQIAVELTRLMYENKQT